MQKGNCQCELSYVPSCHSILLQTMPTLSISQFIERYRQICPKLLQCQFVVCKYLKENIQNWNWDYLSNIYVYEWFYNDFQSII